jgi:two-component system, LytTR family, sensor kinase
MQYQSILRKWPVRLMVALLTGVSFKFISDVIYGLMYRNYEVFQPISQYLLVIVPSLVTIELFWFASQLIGYKKACSTNPARRFTVQGLWYCLIIFVVFIVFRWIFMGVFMSGQLIVVKDELILIGLVLFVAILFNLIDLGVFLLYRWRFSLAELERFKKENAEFRFEMLRSQINPHFLFNSFNTLSALMHENVETAASFIRQMSQVYRYVLENQQKELVDLTTELTFIQSYQYLLELRFQERLKINISVDDDFKKKLIAPMTLQLLVENAVKHNIITQSKPLIINIFCLDDCLTIENNLQPKEPEGGSTGFGLRNIKLRYEVLTDRPIDIKNKDGKFSVSIPLLNELTIKE